MLEKIKGRMGIHESVKIYDLEIAGLISDATHDLGFSGVPKGVINKQTNSVLTAITMYVKANFGNDRSDTNRYMTLYRQKVFRLTMEEGGKDVE